ncbi:MAG: DUF4097 family beta strand repeat protein [Gemmatimonadaceae bacterium]|nr:DUF4097 family beta strand repeat protein [Gemmatimonadaceae bacterium]
MLSESATAQTKVDRAIQLNRDGSFRIWALAGTVRVIGWEKDSVRVRATIPAADQVHLGGGASGAKMFVEAVDERNPQAATIEVTLPKAAKLWVKTATAQVAISGITGSLDIYTVSGAITVSGSPADLNAEAMDGNISVTGSPRWIRAKSASGNVQLRGSSSDATLSTVSGEVSVSGGEFEKAKFESVTGPIRFDGLFVRGGSIVFDSHSGRIDISIPRLNSADIEVVTIAGKIQNALTGARAIPGRYGRGAELITANNGGGTQVTIRSFKGDVTLRATK